MGKPRAPALTCGKSSGFTPSLAMLAAMACTWRYVMNRASVHPLASISHIKLNRLNPENGRPLCALYGREWPRGATHGFCHMELPASMSATMRSAASRYIWFVICSIVFFLEAVGAPASDSERVATASGVESSTGTAGDLAGFGLGLRGLAFFPDATRVVVFLGFLGFSSATALDASASISSSLSMWFSWGGLTIPS